MSSIVSDLLSQHDRAIITWQEVFDGLYHHIASTPHDRDRVLSDLRSRGKDTTKLAETLLELATYGQTGGPRDAATCERIALSERLQGVNSEMERLPRRYVVEDGSERQMKVLFFHGLEGTPHGSKIQFLRANHIYVMAPLLSRDDFAGDLETAQSAFEELQPDVVVGSSRGGAVAVNIDAKNVPLVLIAPAWRHWGTASSVKRNTTILHSKHDDLVPIAGSRELLANSGLTEDRLVVVGAEHRMSDDAALAALLRAVADAAQKPA